MIRSLSQKNHQQSAAGLSVHKRALMLWQHSLLRCGLACLFVGCGALSLAAEEGTDVPDVHPVNIGDVKKNNAIEISVLRDEIKQLQEAGRHSDARALMQKILLLMPDEKATQKDLRAYQGTKQQGSVDYGIQQQLLTVEAHGHLLRAEHLAEKQDVETALVEVDLAQNLHQRILGGLTGEALIRLRELQKRLLDERRRESLAEREQDRLQNQRHMLELVENKSQRAANVFDQRIVRITTLVEKALYEEALSYCRNLVRDYPGDSIADAMFIAVLNLAHEQRALSYEERMSDIKKEIKHQQHDALIPRAWNGWPIFADDWQDRIVSREVDYYKVDLPDWQLLLMNKMKERIDVRFEDTDIGDALDFLSTRVGINIVVDPDVRASGVTVAINARNMAVANILNWLSEQADSQWEYFNEAVYFGAEQESKSFIRIYDVAQVVFVPRDFPGMELALNAPGAGDGGSIFSNDAFDDDGDGVAPEDLIDLIQETVNPLGWEDHDDWGINIRGTVLMVTTTATTHLLIQDFINALRDSNDIQVNISAKWLTISDDFMEEIGMNWINDGNFPNVTGDGVRTNGNQADHEFDANVSNFLPGTPMEMAQGIIGKGLNLHLAILGGIQALAVFEAVEARQKGRVLEHIELTVKNGSQGNAFIGRSIAYISDYDVETGSGGNPPISRLDPVISNLQVGATMDIKPFVSSDRKFVTLDLKPDFATVDFGIAEVVALQVFPGGIGIPVVHPIELPVVRMNRVRTRVMIPDRGSVLVGGFQRHLEQNSYAQIPVLGNIPFIGRLFGRRGIYESRQSLYLSVGAKIILYPELEALQ